MGALAPFALWNVDIISCPLYLAVNCSVSLASEHRYADFWEMIPGMVSAFYTPCSAVDTCMASVYEARQKFTREGDSTVQFLDRLLSRPLLCTTCAGWSRQCRIAWRCRRCSSCAVVVVAVFMQRQVPGSPGTGFRSVHRQDRDGLECAFFCLIFEAFFALRPAGREGQGGGDAASLDSQCSATRNRCRRAVISTKTSL